MTINKLESVISIVSDIAEFKAEYLALKKENEYLKGRLEKLEPDLKAPNSEYKPATPQLNQLRKLLLEQKQLDPEINKLVNDNFWDLI